MRRVQASDYHARLSEAYQHQGTGRQDSRGCGNGLQPYLLHHRHGHERQGTRAFTIPEAKGKVCQAHRQAKESYLLRGRVLRDSPLHRTVLPLLFPLHLSSIRDTRAIAQRPQSMCGVSEDDRVLHQNQGTSWLF